MKQLRADILIEAGKIGITMAVLFGSQAQGVADVLSDYDIAILTDSANTIHDNMNRYSDVLEFFAKELGIPEEKLDISSINEANPLLKYGIFANGILLFGDVDEFDEQRAMAFREYIDAEQLFNLERVLNKKRNERLSRQPS